MPLRISKNKKEDFFLKVFLFLSFIFACRGFTFGFEAFPFDSHQSQSLGSQSGKPMVLVFLSSKCPCSQDSHTLINDTARKFHDAGFSFYGIHSNQDEDLQQAKEFFEKSNLLIPVFHDKDAKIAQKLGAVKTPHVFVVDTKTGATLYQGGIADSRKAESATVNYLSQVLGEIQKTGKAPFSEKRVLGCFIDRG